MHIKPNVTSTNTDSGIKPKYQFSQSALAPLSFLSKGAIVKETMDISLMRMLRAGPEVSLKGSPTVSPPC